MNNNKIVYIPHDKENESKGEIWISLEQWNLWKEFDKKSEEEIFKNMWNLKLDGDE